MVSTLLHLLRAGMATQRELFPPLPEHSRGLPGLTDKACTDCGACEEVCPTRAITVSSSGDRPEVRLDLGLCIVCGLCSENCSSSAIVETRDTRTAVRRREDLILTTQDSGQGPDKGMAPTRGPRPQGEGRLQRLSAGTTSPFKRSIHLREVATGDSATDLEIAAANNPIFDSSRFGINFVASPRFADGLLVTGPVSLAMQEPLRRCFEAMADPRLVIAAGASAISGGVHRGGYAGANGVDTLLPVDIYIPGNPPHPWSILHGILLAMRSSV